MMSSICARCISKGLQRQRHDAVDDLEVTAARQLLELHQREVGLDAGGVAIHHQADGARGRDHTHLCVAEAVRGAEFQRAIPGQLGRGHQRGIGAVGGVQRHRCGAQRLHSRLGGRKRRGGDCG